MSPEGLDPQEVVYGDRYKPRHTKNAKQLIDKMLAEISSHDEHNRKQVGNCVYCADCDKRLYQGTLND